MKFTTPEIELVKFEQMDVIAASTGDDDDSGVKLPEGDDWE